jgi:site-specific DNA recombinase
VSGGKPLSGRPGLGAAVAAIEAGDAEVVAAAYFDRLFRSLALQAEVVDRVERVDGKVLTVDAGEVRNASAGQWLSGTMMGAVSEYYRRSVKERSGEGQARAVARGAVLWRHVPLGYRRKDDATLEPDPECVPIVRRAFEMRASGSSHTEIRKMLKSHGISRSPRGVQVMLSSRTYLGEIHFGKLVNLRAHEAIVDRDLFNRVQRMIVPRGPQPPSERLLARLGVLLCGSCGARLGTMKLPRQNDYPIYRCPSWSDCAHHVTISAEIAEQVVTDAVQAAIADMEGRASVAENVHRAVEARDRAQAELDAALRSFTAAGLSDEPAAVERLAELRQARDDAEVQLDQLGPQAAETVNAATDWDRLSRDGRRDLIRATVESAIVAPKGRGAGRIKITLRGQ